MTREQIKLKVLTAIDEVSNTEFSNINIDTQIEAFLDESAQQITYTTPDKYFSNKVSFIENEHKCDTNGCGWIKLPENTVRVTAFQIEDWNNEINIFYTKNSEVNKNQSNIYLRGGTQKPVAIVDSTKLYYYSAKKPTTTTPKIIVADAITELSANEDFPERLIPMLVWLCASKTLQVMNDLTASEQALNQYNNLTLIFK